MLKLTERKLSISHGTLCFAVLLWVRMGLSQKLVFIGAVLIIIIGKKRFGGVYRVLKKFVIEV